MTEEKRDRGQTFWHSEEYRCPRCKGRLVTSGWRYFCERQKCRWQGDYDVLQAIKEEEGDE